VKRVGERGGGEGSHHPSHVILRHAFQTVATAPLPFSSLPLSFPSYLPYPLRCTREREREEEATS